MAGQAMHGTRRQWLGCCAGLGAAWLTGARAADEADQATSASPAAPAMAAAASAASAVKLPRSVEAVVWPARQPSPKLEASDLDGKLWRLQDLQGRAVVLNFWASRSPTSAQEMPTLQGLADLYGPDRLVVLTINVKDSEARAAQFARSIGVHLPVLLDPRGEAAQKWSVQRFPSTILVGADGLPRQRVRGDADWTSPSALRLVEPLFRIRRRS